MNATLNTDKIDNLIAESITANFAELDNSKVELVETFHALLTGSDNGAGLQALASVVRMAGEANGAVIITADYRDRLRERFNVKRVGTILAESFKAGLLETEDGETPDPDESLRKAFETIAKDARGIYAALSTLGIATETAKKLDEKFTKAEKASMVRTFVTNLHSALQSELSGAGFIF